MTNHDATAAEFGTGEVLMTLQGTTGFNAGNINAWLGVDNTAVDRFA